MVTALVVDDSKLMRDFISNTLSRSGYSIIHATNGLEAIDRYRNNPVDVVVLDIVMDEADGLEALKGIREYDPHAKVVMCSSMSYKLLVLEAVKMGASDFIAKPFKTEDLLEAVNKCVSGKVEKTIDNY
ncbi:MAG: response regulator [Agathobacter sp.]|nr:response regulator [Agathobacter sp.]